MIPKKLHYIWFWKWEKPQNFNFFLDSWKKFCPDYEIIERNEENYDINKNYYVKKYYNKKEYAFASDYARFDIIYKEGGIYLDVDMQILKSLDFFLENKWFTWFQDEFYIWWGIFWAEKWNEVLKEILDFYEKRKTKIIITFVFKKILKKYWLKKYNWKTQKLKNFTIYEKQYFYPYSFFEKFEEKNITKNTYAMHHFNASWLPKILLIPTNFVFKKFKKIKKND